MKNSELQQLLASYPADLDIKILADNKLKDFTGETLIVTSHTAKLSEDEEVNLGDGEQYILLNSIIQ